MMKIDKEKAKDLIAQIEDAINNEKWFYTMEKHCKELLEIAIKYQN